MKYHSFGIILTENKEIYSVYCYPIVGEEMVWKHNFGDQRPLSRQVMGGKINAKTEEEAVLTIVKKLDKLEEPPSGFINVNGTNIKSKEWYSRKI